MIGSCGSGSGGGCDTPVLVKVQVTVSSAAKVMVAPWGAVVFATSVGRASLVSVKVQVTVSLAARVMEAVAVPGPATGGAVVVKVLVPRLDTQLSPVRTQPAGMASLTE